MGCLRAGHRIVTRHPIVRIFLGVRTGMFVELGIMQFLSHSIIPCSLFVLTRVLGSDGSRAGALKVSARPVPAVRQAFPHGSTDRGCTVPAPSRDARSEGGRGGKG